MAREILLEWLSGEKSLPGAIRDWLDDHSRRELASGVAIFVVQAIVGSLLVSVTVWTAEFSVATLRSASPVMAVVVVLLSIVAVEVTALLVVVRKVGRVVERSLGGSGEPRTEPSGMSEGKLHANGVKIDDPSMNPRSNGGENP